MRVTQSMYYDSLYGTNNSNLSKRLFDVNKQIASGLKIQYASDDIATFTETMRLDNEITTLNQITKSTESAYKMSNQTDVVLNEFETAMNKMRTLLVQSANDTNSETSLDAISAELRGLRGHFMNLSNTSINGQFLFSGSAVDIKPISDDGTYNGNGVSMNAFLGSNSQQQFNLTGADLFLGEEVHIRREITTNVAQTSNEGTTLDKTTTMADFMGVVPAGHEHNFYIRGVQSDGTAFSEVISLTNVSTVDTLLNEIGSLYGNTGTVDVVNVTMNERGQIEIQDKIKGSSKLDFHMVGASDFGGGDSSVVANIDDLEGNGGSTDYLTAQGSASQLYIREFNKSPFASAGGAVTMDGLSYDRTEFSKTGSILSSNVSQIVKDDNSFASNSTKLYEVFSGITYRQDGTYLSGLDGKKLKLEGIEVDGVTPYDVEINLLDAGSTFTYNGNDYNIYGADSSRNISTASDVTYKQLMDIVNMAITGSIPAGSFADETEYDTAVENATFRGSTTLDYAGKIQFEGTSRVHSDVSLALYDLDSGDFSNTTGSMTTFNANNSLTISDAKTDFFKSIDEMIKAVENYSNHPDSDNYDMRSIGIQNSMQKMDDLQEHVFRSHSLVGAQSNTLTNSLERTEILKLSTTTLRSSVIDTDLAEASLELTQLTLNYEAMLSTVGRVSKLSLVNYL